MATVRPAEGGDHAELALLLRELGYPSTTERVAAALEIARCDPGGVLVAEEAGRLVGFVSYQLVYFFEDGAPRCHLTAIAVTEPAREQGVGRALVDAMEQKARAAGCTAVELTSALGPERRAAHRFYAALGYHDGSRRATFHTKALEGIDRWPRGPRWTQNDPQPG